MSILRIENLKKYYGKGEHTVKALDDVSINVEKGEFVAIVGTSGSGKSTLLHMLGGLDRATEGKVYVNGHDIFQMSDEKLTIFRRRSVGFVFQSYNLVPILSVLANIVLPIELDGGQIDREYLNLIISSLGLQEKVGNLPSALSGGQQQRVAIARALATKPSVFWPMSPPAILTAGPARRYLSC